MDTDIDLKRLESRAWTSYFQDGLWDIFIGVMLLTMGLNLWVDSPYLSLGMILAPLVVIAGKQLVTIPRLGVMRFSRERLDRVNLTVPVVVVAVVVTMTLFVAGLSSRFPEWEYTGLLFVAMVVIIFSMLGYLLEYRRLAVYGALFALAMALRELGFREEGLIAYLVFGAVILLVGLACLASFVRAYPLDGEDGPDAA